MTWVKGDKHIGSQIINDYYSNKWINKTEKWKIRLNKGWEVMRQRQGTLSCPNYGVFKGNHGRRCSNIKGSSHEPGCEPRLVSDATGPLTVATEVIVLFCPIMSKWPHRNAIYMVSGVLVGRYNPSQQKSVAKLCFLL